MNTTPKHRLLLPLLAALVALTGLAACSGKSGPNPASPLRSLGTWVSPKRTATVVSPDNVLTVFFPVGSVAKKVKVWIEVSPPDGLPPNPLGTDWLGNVYYLMPQDLVVLQPLEVTFALDSALLSPPDGTPPPDDSSPPDGTPPPDEQTDPLLLAWTSNSPFAPVANTDLAYAEDRSAALTMSVDGFHQIGLSQEGSITLSAPGGRVLVDSDFEVGIGIDSFLDPVTEGRLTGFLIQGRKGLKNKAKAVKPMVAKATSDDLLGISLVYTNASGKNVYACKSVATSAVYIADTVVTWQMNGWGNVEQTVTVPRGKKCGTSSGGGGDQK